MSEAHPAHGSLPARVTLSSSRVKATARGAAGTGAGSGVTVSTATGQHVVAPGLNATSVLPLPPCEDPAVVRPFVDVAAAVVVNIPSTSAAKIAGAARRFREVRTALGMGAVTFVTVLVYIVARCCPPVGAPLPACCASPVLPTTVAGDVDALRRGAALGVEALGDCLDALSHVMVSNLLRAIGARVKRLKTSKKPLLFAQVLARWTVLAAVGTAEAVRDGFALVLAFFFGMRVSELIGLMPEDIHCVKLAGGRRAMRVTFRKTKTRQTMFITHEPFNVTCAHPLLVEAWGAFEARHDYYDRTTIFHRRPGPQGTRDPLSRNWFAGVVAAAAPGTTPHSCRVGLASEMWAAKCSIEEIMSAGRWSSVAALMYVIGCLEDQVRASDRIGSNSLRMVDGDLRRGGFSPNEADALRGPLGPKGDATLWASIARRVPEPDVD